MFLEACPASRAASPAQQSGQPSPANNTQDEYGFAKYKNVFGSMPCQQARPSPARSPGRRMCCKLPSELRTATVPAAGAAVAQSRVAVRRSLRSSPELLLQAL